jgi:hypothetical protein
MPLPRLLATAVAAVVWLAIVSDVRAVDRNVEDVARSARTECEQGRRAQGRDDRKAHFERGKALAQQAVTMDDHSADAHFALFCNEGELMRLDGESISSIFRLRQLMAELDRTLALKPDHTDALAAKGTMLLRLPRLMGGDPTTGEQMLRQVVQQDPNAFSSRLTLAKTCNARGDRNEAVAFAERALQIAKAQGRADKVAEAQATLAELEAE